MKQSETQFQDAVAAFARLKGWRVFHPRKSRTGSGGWATAVQYDGVGFPDLTLARDHRVMFFELKSESGRATESQLVWLDTLPDAYCFRPKDWPQIELLLK